MNRSVALYRKYGVAGVARRVAQKLRAILPAKSRDDIRRAFVADLVPITREVYRIGFHPEVPTTNYLIASVCKLLNGTPSEYDGNPANFDAVFHWEDKTIITQAEPTRLNGRCTSIGKEHVATAFAKVFGYDLSVDPEQFVSAAVMKSDENGMHDGRIVQCPTKPVPEYVFQRVVDNVVGKSVEDLRVSIIGSHIGIVLRKHRFAYERFANTAHDARIVSRDDVFSPDEQSKLIDLARELGLDVGDFDVLRDRGDNRIYVVDAAKTPFGPPLSLDRQARVEMATAVARSFRRQFLKEADQVAAT